MYAIATGEKLEAFNKLVVALLVSGSARPL